MAKKETKCKCRCFCSNDVSVESHTRDIITGKECTFRRHITRSSVPVLDAIVRVILAVGLVVSAWFLVWNMKSGSLKELEDTNKKCIAEVKEYNKNLSGASTKLDDLVRELDDIRKEHHKWCWCLCWPWEAGGK